MFKINKNKKRASAIKKTLLPKRVLPKIYLVRALLVMLLIGVGYTISQLDINIQLFPVKQVRIEGEFNHLDKERIKSHIASYSVGGFFDLDIVSLRNELIQMQWVEDAFVRREWPESVIIRVVEKKPVAKWNSDAVLTANGNLFYPDGSIDDLQLVQLKGPLERHAFVLTEFNKIQSLLHQAEIKVDVLSQNERRSWQMSIEGMTIHLGRKNIYKKIENLAAVYATLIKPRTDKIKQIDFRYTNGFSVSWKSNNAKNIKFENSRVTDMNQIKAEMVFLIGATKDV